jgi:hypothetical protein
MGSSRPSKSLCEIRVNEKTMELNRRVLLPAAEVNQLRTERLDFRSGDPIDHSVLCIDFS